MGFGSPIDVNSYAAGGTGNAAGQMLLPTGRWANTACSDTFVCSRTSDALWLCRPNKGLIVPASNDGPLLETASVPALNVLSPADQGLYNLASVIQRQTGTYVQSSAFTSPPARFAANKSASTPSLLTVAPQQTTDTVSLQAVLKQLPYLGLTNITDVENICGIQYICHVAGIDDLLKCCKSSKAQASQPAGNLTSFLTIEAGPSFAATVKVDGGWSDGTAFYNAVNIFLQNTGPDNVNVPYRVTISRPSYLGVTQTWNWAATALGDTISGTVNAASWQNLLPRSGSTVNIGMLVKSRENSFTPTAMTVNGAPVALAGVPTPSPQFSPPPPPKPSPPPPTASPSPPKSSPSPVQASPSPSPKLSPPPPPPTSAPKPPSTPPAPASPYSTPNINFKPPPALRITNAAIVKSDGSPAQLKGFNWFGFNQGAGAPDGLYGGFGNPHTQVTDFATVVYRQQLLGFNAVRIPFRFGDISVRAGDAGFKSYTQRCRIDTAAEVKANITNPTAGYNRIDYSALNLPAPAAPVLSGSAAATGICNNYLPNDTILNRFLWVIQYFIGNGFYVILDYQIGTNSDDQIIMSNTGLLAQNWVNLYTAIMTLPKWRDGTIRGKFLIDVANEPSLLQIKWDRQHVNAGTNVNYPSWSDLYFNVALALTTMDNQLLFLVEGVSQDCCINDVAYGGGFVTNTTWISSQGYGSALTNPDFTLPSSFFQKLAGVPLVRDRTIVAPHIYGPNTTGWQGPVTAETGLYDILYYSFAYLQKQGYAGVRYPVVVGEFGSGLDLFNTNPAFQNQKDAAFMHNLGVYTNWIYSYLGVRISNFVWWCWNANTNGGLNLVGLNPATEGFPYAPTTTATRTSPLPWQNIQWIKINNMTTQIPSLNPYGNANTGSDCVGSGGGFHLVPWYLQTPTVGRENSVPLTCP